MSSREHLWYCHQCNAEMRPLMVPDPVCASCHGSFVEKMDDPEDDPREFHNGADLGLDDGVPVGLDTFLMSLQTLMERSRNTGRGPSSPRPSEPSPGLTFSVRRTGPHGGTSTITFGRSSSSNTQVPTMSDFLHRGSEPGEGRGIAGPLMAQYLMALLGGGIGGSMFPAAMLGDAADRGRMGDYVFNQEALDQIITQIMESSNAHRPVPATDEIMQNLPREVLEEGSPALEKDCAVCKEQFKTETEDPDEQVVVTLPCKHLFHEPCIMPWLKSSGTCPVCRHALVPQPEQHHQGSPPPTASRGSQSSPSPPSPSSRPRSTGNDPDSLFQSFFGYMPGSGGRQSGSGTSPRPDRDSGSGSRNIPGRFPGEDID